MKISFKVHGGWGGRFMPPLTIDTAMLPPVLAAEVTRLASAAEAAAAANTAAAAKSGQAPEAMTYTITIEDGDRTTTLKGSDVDSCPHFHALADWVRQHVGGG